MEVTWAEDDLNELRRAVHLLEDVSFIAKVSNLIGEPIEKIIDFLPSSTSGKITDIVNAALRKALRVALATLDLSAKDTPSNLRHKIAVGASGAVGGAFGLPALAVELPISTTIMLRSIADIARSQGEGLGSLPGQLECLLVFALGSPSESDDASKSVYFAARAGLAAAMQSAARYIASHGLGDATAPPIVRLLAQIASRFGSVVAEKVAAFGVPVLGAVGGATINVLLMDHFQDIATGHFIVRRLERTYGSDEVRRKYDKIHGAKRSTDS